MPNYKICRFCPEKYVPIADEKICPKCRAEIVNVLKSEALGEPIVAGVMTDANAKAMREAVVKANAETLEAITPVIETIAEVLAPVVEAVVEAVETQVEKDIVVVEEAIVELNKGEDAEVIKEEIIAPSAPKPDVPEEKPDAAS